MAAPLHLFFFGGGMVPLTYYFLSFRFTHTYSYTRKALIPIFISQTWHTFRQNERKTDLNVSRSANTWWVDLRVFQTFKTDFNWNLPDASGDAFIAFSSQPNLCFHHIFFGSLFWANIHRIVPPHGCSISLVTGMFEASRQAPPPNPQQLRWRPKPLWIKLSFIVAGLYCRRFRSRRSSSTHPPNSCSGSYYLFWIFKLLFLPIDYSWISGLG